MIHTASTHRDRLWLLIAFLSVGALAFGELFEQIVFVPNWLIGDVDANMEHFRQFKHTTDPGLFYFPTAIMAIVAHVLLLRKASTLSLQQQKAVQTSLTLFLIVLGLTIYIITQINIPVIDQGRLSGAAQTSKVQLWALLNLFRIVLPAYGLYQ